MKTYYEDKTRSSLIRRMPVILRLDGKAFHTLTRGCEKPFDKNFIKCMEDTAMRLCAEVQNARFAYSQSDEISLLLTDYDNLDTDQWFDGNIQKICSISASIASVCFTKEFGKDAYFDARVFNIPKEEVCNYFIWRQQDASRNSVQGLGQAYFSHKSLIGLNNDQVQEKLWQERQVNWNNLPTNHKRGFCLRRIGTDGNWMLDRDIPIFTSDREYVEKSL